MAIKYRKWDNDSFIEAFITNDLGRKTVHGNLFIIESEECDLLINKAYHGVLVIRFPELAVVSMVRQTRYMSMPMENCVRVDANFNTNQDYTDSRVIDTAYSVSPKGVKHIDAVVDLGGQHYLLDSCNENTYERRSTSQVLNGLIGEETQPGKRRLISLKTPCESVKEARTTQLPSQVRENFHDSFKWGPYWFIQQHEEFQPPEERQEDLEFLKKGYPHPAAFNVTTLSKVQWNKYEHVYTPLRKNNNPLIAEVEQWAEAVERYKIISTRWHASRSSEWLQNNRLTLRGGNFRYTMEGIFLYGNLSFDGRWNHTTGTPISLPRWHRMIDPSEEN